MADNWKKLREETKNKKIKNSDLSRNIKKEFLQLLSYSSIKHMSRYDLLIYDLFSFLREDFIFQFEFYKEAAYLNIKNPIEDFYIEEFIMNGTIGDDKNIQLRVIPKNIKNLYVSKPVYNKFINVIQALEYNIEDFISTNTTLHFLEDFENIDEIKERFV